MRSRNRRDRIADLGFFLFAACFSVVTSDNVLVGEELSDQALFADQFAGALACGALFLRRRLPVPLAVALLVAGSFSHFVTGPTMVALFTVAAHRPARVTRRVAVLAGAPLPLFLLSRPSPELPATASAVIYFALVAGSLGWGLYVRSRHELIAGLRERAERAETQARRQAREDVAREMHDVLAHRLSLLSVHAGALEFHPDAPPAEVQRAAGVIRDSAHQALDDLREIIGVLRTEEFAGGDRPQPTLTDLPQLVAESEEAGMRVVLDLRVDAAPPVPPAAGRTAYRVVQEGLTNARKHAREAEVVVVVGGGPDEGLAVEVRNALPGNPAGAAVPGAGQGLIGLAERAKLASGRLEHGRAGGEFLLRAWLPWSTPGGAPSPGAPLVPAVGEATRTHPVRTKRPAS